MKGLGEVNVKQYITLPLFSSVSPSVEISVLGLPSVAMEALFLFIYYQSIWQPNVIEPYDEPSSETHTKSGFISSI